MNNDKQDAIAYLKKSLRNQSIIYTSCNHVSSSGMTRHISCYIGKKGKIENITWHVSKLLGYRRNPKDGGLVVGGCGMDMGFHVVYSIGRVLYPKSVDNGYKFNHQWL